jgi:hypothetical protein
MVDSHTDLHHFPRLSSICLSRFVLNLRSIELSKVSLNLTSAGAFSNSEAKYSLCCPYVGNAGAPVSLSRGRVVEYEEDFLDLDEDEEMVGPSEVSEDPLMTGIIAEME